MSVVQDKLKEKRAEQGSFVLSDEQVEKKKQIKQWVIKHGVIGNADGRPPQWGSAEELFDEIYDYVTERRENGKPITISGLALHVGVVRQTIWDYMNNKSDQFTNVLKWAIENSTAYAEEQLFASGKGQTGAMFYLKNNTKGDDRYRDRHEIEHNHTINVGSALEKLSSGSDRVIDGEVVE